MIAVLHLGPFDGSEFDLRTWSAVPDEVYARRGGTGRLGVQLSRREKLGDEKYVFVVNNSDEEYHYRWAGGNGDTTAEFFIDHELEDLRDGS